MADTLVQGSNFKLAEKSDEDDEIVKISEDFTSEKFAEFISDMIEYTQTDDVYNEMPDGSPGGWGDAAAIIFKDSRAFFSINRMKYGFELQNTDIIYGILPMPKYDASQESYNTCVDNSYTLYGICTDTQDGDRASAVIQSLGYYGKTLTTPAIFDVTFKGKFSKDPAMIDMFDRIRNGICFDMGLLYMRELNSINDQPTQAILNNTDWSIAMGAFQQKALNNLLSKFNKNLETAITA